MDQYTMLSLPAVLKDSTLEAFVFRENSLTVNLKHWYNNPAGEFSRVYSLTFSNVSNCSLVTNGQAYPVARLQAYPELQFLVLLPDPIETDADKLVLLGRILFPFEFR